MNSKEFFERVKNHAALSKQVYDNPRNAERRQPMNYDITFCEGKGCNRRENCHRYRELMRFRADTDPNRKTLISKCQPDPGKCTLFWTEETESNDKLYTNHAENAGKIVLT